MSVRTIGAAAGLVATAGVIAAVAVGRADGGERPATVERPERLTATSTADVHVLTPGGGTTGTLQLTNRGSRARRVTDVVFAAPTSDACRRSGVALAPTVALTPESPLQVPADGSAALGWTAFMDGSGEHACQGETLTSEVLVDGTPAGTVTLTAGTLEPPPAPTGGLTTSTRAAVRWSPSTAASPGWVVERAVADTDDWQPACGTSARRPLRALSCTDTGLVKATAYVYRVTLRTGHWHATSRPSVPVITQERPSA